MEDISGKFKTPADFDQFIREAQAFRTERPVAQPKAKKRRGIPSKGTYGRKLNTIQTPDGAREYHFTKGFRSCKP